jgi:peptidoglycan/xylan/chitin deacetylase (PgdA/CDA1 family)
MDKTWIKNVLLRTGALRLASRRTAPEVAIIMYHSVMDDPAVGETTLGGIIHSTEVFRQQMEIVVRHFRAVSLDDVLLFLQGKKSLPPRSVVITFDDGYADNYQAAKNILTPLGIPAVFYVVVDSIDRQRLPWPGRLRYAFLTSAQREWAEAAGRTWSLASTEQRLAGFERASEYCSKLAGAPQDQFVETIEQTLGTSPPRSAARMMLTWDEARSLARDGHTVGSHTLTHPNMAYLAEDVARLELQGAKTRMEQELSAPVLHFSYPCPALQPHWSDGTVQASREIGYQTAVTTNGGVVRKNHDPLSLRRIRPSKTVQGLHWNLECAFLGRAV